LPTSLTHLAESPLRLARVGEGDAGAQRRGERLGLTEDEVAFYDALEVNDSAVKVPGDDALKRSAQELLKVVRKNLTIDWTMRENVPANLHVTIKRILRKHGYQPDKQERATATVLLQMETLSRVWTESGEFAAAE
jgi:type I restriction enzyme R subunit